MLSFCENVYIITLKSHLVSIQMNNFKILKLVSNIIYSHNVHIPYTYFAPPPQLKSWLRHWLLIRPPWNLHKTLFNMFDGWIPPMHYSMLTRAPGWEWGFTPSKCLAGLNWARFSVEIDQGHLLNGPPTR